MQTTVPFSLMQVLPAIGIMALVTFLTRSVVFYGLRRLGEWPILQPLREHLPSCAMLILSAYTLRSTLTNQPHAWMAIFIGLAVMTVFHMVFQRMLLSLIIGMASVAAALAIFT